MLVRDDPSEMDDYLEFNKREEEPKEEIVEIKKYIPPPVQIEKQENVEKFLKNKLEIPTESQNPNLLLNSFLQNYKTTAPPKKSKRKKKRISSHSKKLKFDNQNESQIYTTPLKEEPRNQEN